ncbi:MAG TPA: TetR/AcrR family transcriptional regulator [Acidimicrobiia bacterium]
MPPPKRITREGVLDRLTAAFAADGSPSMDELAAAAGVSRAALYSLFGTRAALLEAIGAKVPPSVADRILAAAGELVVEGGLAGLSLDETASRSGVSRATVYRLYPGKAALFRGVVKAHLPLDESLGVMATVGDLPPKQVMPMLARMLTQAGYVRVGVLRSALLEITRRDEDTEAVLDEVLQSTTVFTGYIERQMKAGRLRPMDPLLAMQLFIAPVMLHIVWRRIIDEYGLTAVPVDEAIDEFTAAWLRAMAPPRRRR